MRGKLLFITGGLVGYVLGARAGRKRYEQIASAATDLWNAPPVQRRVTEVRDFALESVGDVPSTLFAAGKKVAASLQDKLSTPSRPGTGAQGGRTSAPPAAAKTAKTTKTAATAKPAAGTTTATPAGSSAADESAAL